MTRVKKYHLTCTLKTHVITDDGDFLPAGTPVTVYGWNDPCGPDRGKLECRAFAYVYAGEFSHPSHGVTLGEDDCPAVGTGYWLAVAPKNLAYSDVEAIEG